MRVTDAISIGRGVVDVGGHCIAAALMRVRLEDDPEPFHGHEAPRLPRGEKTEECGASGARGEGVEGDLCARLVGRRVGRRRQFPRRLHFDGEGRRHGRRRR